MWDWLANLLQTAKIRELEEGKAELSERAEAANLARKDAKRLYRSMKKGFDARGEELLVKQETIRMTNQEIEDLRNSVAHLNEELEEARRQSTDWRYQAETMQLQKEDATARIDQLEGEAEEGRKAFHELAGRHDVLREVEGEAQEALTKAMFKLSAREQQIGELRESVDYWVSAYWRVRRQSDDWQALYDIKRQQLMDTVGAYREYRRAIVRFTVTADEHAKGQRQIARLEETVKRKDARVAYLEEELRRSLKRDPKTGRIIGGNYRGKR